MTKPKFIVYCGQELCIDRDVPDVMPGYEWTVWPEAICGANWVRAQVQDQIKLNKPTVYVTRYEHIVSELANMVADGKLSRDDVEFNLVQIIDGKAVASKHKMSEDSQTIGDNWPIGVLW